MSVCVLISQLESSLSSSLSQGSHIVWPKSKVKIACDIDSINLFIHILFIYIDGAGTNKQHVTTKNTAKLDRETEELRHDKIPLDVGKIIQQGRQNKGLSQKDLATVGQRVQFLN